jgi:hypothetical protein
VAGGAALLYAFTDPQRVQRFAVAERLAAPDGSAPVLSMPVPGFLGTVASWRANGVRGLHFNARCAESWGASFDDLDGIRRRVAEAGARAMTPADAFALAYEPHRISEHLDGAKFLAAVARGASTAAELAKTEMAAWPKRGPAVVTRVLDVESILRELGRPAPPPPRDDASFATWNEHVQSVLRAASTDDPSLPVDARMTRMRLALGRSAGLTIGDVVQTLAFASVVEAMRRAAPTYEWLARQSEALAKSQDAAARRFETLRHLAIHARDEVQRALEAAQRASASAPRIGTADATPDALARAAAAIAAIDVRGALGR